MIEGIDIKKTPFLVFQNKDIAEKYQREISKSLLNQNNSCDNVLSDVFFF